MAVAFCCAMSLGLVACNTAEQQQQQRSERPSSSEEETPRAASGEPTDETAPEEEEARRAASEQGEASPESGTDLAGLLAEGGDGGGAGAYKTVAAAALTVEVPAGWEYDTGADSEGEGGSWSAFGGEALDSSITAAADLRAWYASPGVAGTYAVASGNLAQRYTDDQLVASGPNDASAFCEPGARSDYERGPYSGMLQAWEDCFGDPEIRFVGLSAAPEGRECVVLLHAWTPGEEGVEAAQHILDTFEVDCGAVSSYPLAAGEGDEQYAFTSEAEPPPEEPQYGGQDPQYEEEPQYDGPPAGGELDCADFDSQAEAQEVYDDDPSDPHGLDGPSGEGFTGEEGVACEDLP
jgi:hypothetical protein